MYNINRNDSQLTVLHNVDDIGASSTFKNNMQRIKRQLDNEFGQLTSQAGPSKEYLGMKVLRNLDGSITLSMNKLLNKIIDQATTTASTPANPNFFKSGGDKSLLLPLEKKIFASMIAQTLFLAQFIRLDILLAVCYLTKETHTATQSSLLKLHRILSYLNSTASLYRHISTAPFTGIVAYVDASFAGHDDYHSQSGLVIELGSTVVFAQSRKQKMITRNSSPAELVALSDTLQTIRNANEFMQEQGYLFKKAIVFEDNESFLKMTNGNAPRQNNKYLGVRQADILIALKETEILLKHVKTLQMKADALR